MSAGVGKRRMRDEILGHRRRRLCRISHGQGPAGRGDEVIGIDNLNAYYDVGLKQARLAQRPRPLQFIKADLADRKAMEETCSPRTPSASSIWQRRPASAIAGKSARLHRLQHGGLPEYSGRLPAWRCRAPGVRLVELGLWRQHAMPFSVTQSVDHPISLYAATKKANELMAHTYAHLYRLPVTGLRFFTVYGPWGRPDMALFLFTRKILAGQPIEVYNARPPRPRLHLYRRHRRRRRAHARPRRRAGSALAALDPEPAPRPHLIASTTSATTGRSS